MKAHLVIGANFGDEGKGQVTEYLCHHLYNSYWEGNNIVVRHNGGAQAAHTVVSEDDSRHVFHHFGSGTFAGAYTLLSEYFIVNPRAFIEEAQLLINKKVHTRVYCHKQAILTTPYDWLLNWKAEEQRGHGSCGMGINETVERCELSLYKTTFADIFDVDSLREKLIRIRDEYVRIRGAELGVEIDDLLNYSMNQYLDECRLMAQMVLPIWDYSVLKQYENVIFEGAQGLLLDEHHYYFPNVTRSKTGSYNAVQILKQMGIDHAEVYYVTRTYLTRHGNGPLPFEEDGFAREDITNIPNSHQGALRFAPLNFDLLTESIQDDLALDFNLTPNLAITWANHDMVFDYVLDDEVYIFENIMSHFDQITQFNEKILFNTPKSLSGKPYNSSV